MPAIARTIIQQWRPSGSAKGGMFTNTNPQEVDASTLDSVQNFYIDGGSWIGIPARTLINANIGASPPTSLQTVGGNGDVIGVIFTNNTYAIYNQSGSALFSGSYHSPANFETVRQRIYMSNATVPSVIDANINAFGTIRWGQPSQAPAALTYTINTNLYNTGTLTTVQNSNAIVGAGTTFAAGMVGFPIFILGVQYTVSTFTDATHINIAPAYAAVGGAGITNWQINRNNVSFQAGNGLRYAVSYYNAGIYNTGNVDITAGNINVTGHSTVFTAAMIGQPIWILNETYTITNVTSGTALTITPAATTTSAGVTNYGVMTTAGSGHTSNISTVISVDDGSPNNAGVSITINNIVYDYTAASPYGYGWIILWRSAHGGGPLYPRTVIPNLASGGPTSYTDNTNTDQILGQFIGQFSAPVTTNTPPPADYNYCTYWDGRMWGWSAARSAIVYSARNDGQEIQIGVAEECFPPTFFIPLPQSEYSITGFKVVANQLAVVGARGIYFIYGNSPSNYIMSNVSSKGVGSYYYAIDRLPGEDINSSDVLVHYGNDRRLYFLYGQGGDVSYSYPVQNTLMATAASSARIKVVHQPSGTYLLCGTTLNPIVDTAVFDVERKVWFDNTMFWTGGYCEVKDVNSGVERIVGTFFTGSVYQLCFWDFSGPNQNTPITLGQYVISTSMSCPPGVSRKAIKRLQEVRVYVNYNIIEAPGVTVLSLGPADTSYGSLGTVSSLGLGYSQFISVETNMTIFGTGGTTSREYVFVPNSGKIYEGLGFAFAVIWGSNITHTPDCSMIEAVFTVEEEDEAIGANEPH